MKIKLVFNSSKEWAKRLCPEVRKYLENNGHRASKINCDATVIIGGDGTILYHKKEIEGMLVGIGSKRSGICQLNRSDWKSGILKILKSKPERVSLLKTRINGRTYSALNEITVRNREFKAIHTTVKYCGKACRFFGDGVLICTRIGSTAYNKSLLGPVFDKDRMCITPIAEISGKGKSSIIDHCPVTVNSLEKSCCIIDGIEIIDIDKKIKIEKGNIVLYGKL